MYRPPPVPTRTDPPFPYTTLFRSVLAVQFQPSFHSIGGVGIDRFRGAFRLAYATVDTLVRMDDEHVFSHVETIDGTDLYAVHVFALDAGFRHHVGHVADRKSTRLNSSP